MNYYKRHIGDYAKDTSWLTTYQHGVYALLLDWYYASQKPIPLDLTHRIVRARSGPEKRAVNEVVAAFFDVTKTPGFAHSKRADNDIAKYKVKSEANSLIALERESTKRARSATVPCAAGEPSHKPLATSHKDQKLLSPAGDCPHAEILEAYHEALPANPRMKVWAGKRMDSLRSRWREDPKRQTLDYWRRFFAHVAASPFLTGKVAGTNGRPFLPGLDWLVLPENFAKVIEGRYHDRG